MDDAKERPPDQAEQASLSVPAANEHPPVDGKMIQELALLPTRREQHLFAQPWLPPIMLLPIGVLFGLGLAQDAYLYLTDWQAQGISFHLDNALYGLDVIYVSLSVMVTVIVWLYQRYARSTPRALRGLWVHGLLSSKTIAPAADGDSPAAGFLRRYQRALGSRWRFALMGAIMVSFGLVLLSYVAHEFTPSFRSFLSTTTTLFVLLKWLVFPQVWIWALATAGWPILVTARALHQLTEDFELGVIPSHPDECGGLKPIGDICLQMALMALVASLVLGYWSSIGSMLRAAAVLPQVPMNASSIGVLNPTREPQPITKTLANVGMLGGIIGGAWLFFYPMLGIHGDMKEKKEQFTQELASAAAEYDAALAKAIQARDDKQIAEAKGRLSTLQGTYSVLKAYPEWPVNRGIVFRFATPQLLSVLALFINFNVGNVKTILDWLGTLGG